MNKYNYTVLIFATLGFILCEIFIWLTLTNVWWIELMKFFIGVAFGLTYGTTVAALVMQIDENKRLHKLLKELEQRYVQNT